MKKYLNNAVIYQVFVRNYSDEGTFKKVEQDLKRIKELGTDILYLMPFQPIGIKERKGTVGSPYSIRDYFGIDPTHGTLQDFKDLVSATHKIGMKLIIDMVFHHTSPDAVLLEQHPEFYYYKPNGKLGNRVGDWTDIVDLACEKDDTQEYLLTVLEYWLKQGVDGFRFDVASLIPISFFKKARAKFGNEIILFAESVEPSFIKYLKENNHVAEEDKDLYPTFDILYDYDTYPLLRQYLKGEKQTVDEYVDAIVRREVDLPSGYIKCCCLENHDNPRIASLVKNDTQWMNLQAFSFCLKGATFLYAGEEFGEPHLVELFEKDPLPWTNYNKENAQKRCDFIKKLSKIKHLSYFSDPKEFHVTNQNGIVVIKFTDSQNNELIGVFNFNSQPQHAKIDKGQYKDLIANSITQISDESLLIDLPKILIKM